MRHVIRKQVLELRTAKAGDAPRLQQELQQYYHRKILPVLERLFNELAGEDELVTLDKVELDIGSFKNTATGKMPSSEELYRLLRAQLVPVIHKAQEPVNAATWLVHEPGKSTPAHGAFAQWLYYMQHGVLPWNAAPPAPQWQQQVLETLATSYTAVEALRKLVKPESTVLQRIIQQHSDDFFIRLIGILTAVDQSVLPGYLQALQEWLPETPGKNIRETIRRALLLTAIEPGSEKATLPLLQNTFRQLYNKGNLLNIATQTQWPAGWEIVLQPLADEGKIPALLTGSVPGKKMPEAGGNTPIKPPSPVPAVNERADKDQETAAMEREAGFRTGEKQILEDGLFAQHAGLVLLHPFFRFLFRNTGLLHEVQFTGSEARQQAVHLLHFIATGEQTAEEHLLAIPKILCGWPLTEPLPQQGNLPAAMQTEADDLLNAAIAQWSILKNTSATGLRESFLQRPGKLFSKNDKRILQVESHAIDVLLDYLPWNLSLVKLPWLEDILWVEWR